MVRYLGISSGELLLIDEILVSNRLAPIDLHRPNFLIADKTHAFPAGIFVVNGTPTPAPPRPFQIEVDCVRLGKSTIVSLDHSEARSVFQEGFTHNPISAGSLGVQGVDGLKTDWPSDLLSGKATGLKILLEWTDSSQYLSTDMRYLLLPLLATIVLLVASCSVSEKQYEQFQYDKALRKVRSAKTDINRWYALGSAAKESFNQGKYAEAKTFALELEKQTPQYRDNWNYGNAVQDFNVVLGRLALRDGDVRAAEKYLLRAGESPGSPQMDSFGPNMSLARDLLLKGRTKVVIQYFGQVRKFWASKPETDPLDKYHADKLDRWTREVKAGEVPDFGANLVY